MRYAHANTHSRKKYVIYGTVIAGGELERMAMIAADGGTTGGDPAAKECGRVRQKLIMKDKEEPQRGPGLPELWVGVKGLRVQLWLRRGKREIWGAPERTDILRIG